MTQQTSQWDSIIDAALDVRLEGLYTGMPGIVARYDRKTQTADIQPAIMQAHRDDTDERIAEAMPVIQSVPVVFLSGGGMRVTFPIKPGDTCWLMFSNSSIDRWKAQGGVVDPADDQRHHPQDAVALVGLRSRKGVLRGVDNSGAPADTLSIGNDDGPTIEIDDDSVNIGAATGTQPTIMATAYRAAENTYLSAIVAAIGAVNAYAAAVGVVVPSTVAAATTLNTAVLTTLANAVTAFNLAASTYVTQIAKVI